MHRTAHTDVWPFMPDFDKLEEINTCYIKKKKKNPILYGVTENEEKDFLPY